MASVQTTATTNRPHSRRVTRECSTVEKRQYREAGEVRGRKLEWSTNPAESQPRSSGKYIARDDGECSSLVRIAYGIRFRAQAEA